MATRTFRVCPAAIANPAVVENAVHVDVAVFQYSKLVVTPISVDAAKPVPDPRTVLINTVCAFEEVTLKTAKEPFSLTFTLLTNTRSSFGGVVVSIKAVAGLLSVALTTPKAPLIPVAKTVPVPSSLMVAVPMLAAPVATVAPMLLAVRVKVSPAAASRRMSFTRATRTNKLAGSAPVPSPSPGICA